MGPHKFFWNTLGPYRLGNLGEFHEGCRIDQKSKPVLALALDLAWSTGGSRGLWSQEEPGRAKRNQEEPGRDVEKFGTVGCQDSGTCSLHSCGFACSSAASSCSGLYTHHWRRSFLESSRNPSRAQHKVVLMGLIKTT